MSKFSLNNDKGMVLILVLIVLLAAIITGIAISRSSILETKIAGNERRYVDSLNRIDSATTYALIVNTAALSAVATTIGAIYTYPTATLPTACNNTNITIELKAIKKPMPGKGYDPGMRARYYCIEATDEAGTQRLRVGTYKVFPSSGE